MVRLRPLLILAVMLPVVTVLSVKGQSDDEFGTGQRVPRYQVGVGAGYRIDGVEKKTYTPSYQARFFRYFSDEFAFIGTLEYNNLTRLESGGSFRTASFGLGVRAEPPIRKLLPMVEVGLWFPYYWGTNHGWDIHDWGPGLRIGAGYRLALGRGLTCEVNISKVLNHVETNYTVAAPASDAPCPPGEDCDYYYTGSSPANAAYNATALELLLRVGM